MKKPEIGVVVPTFNSAKTLEWALLALNSQEGCRVKIIAVDSGSSDDTLEICDRHKVKTEYDSPGNMYRALNKGMRLLDTEWCTYLNGDDIVYQDSYARLMKYGDTKQADIVYGHCDYINFHGRFLSSLEAVPVAMLAGLFLQSGVMGFAQHAAIFRKVVYEDLKGFSEKYLSIADFDFFSRAVLSGERFERLSPPTVTAFRLHSNQFSRREDKVAEEEIFLFFKEWKVRNPLLGLLSFNMWCFLNAKHYLLRILRNGQFKSRHIG